MFNISTISNLYGVVGLRQPYNPDYAIIDSANLTSRSGYVVTDNPLCKVEWLKDGQDYQAISDADFNTVLEDMQKASIVSVSKLVFNKSDYIDRQILYSNAQNRVNTETLESGLVCHKIQVSNKKNIAFEITRVLLDFEGSGDITLMLFNTSQDAPLFSDVITINTTHQVQTLNWKVDNSGGTYKGDYYLGYLTNTGSIGTLKPFKRDYENSDVESIITHLDIEKFQFKGHATAILPDLTTEDGLSEAIGVNPDITVYEDYTDLIVQNEALFASAINTEFQIRFLTQSMASLRSNRNERVSQDAINQILLNIEGVNVDDGIKVTGLSSQLFGAISNIRQEIKRLKDGYFTGRLSVTTLI